MYPTWPYQKKNPGYALALPRGRVGELHQTLLLVVGGGTAPTPPLLPPLFP